MARRAQDQPSGLSHEWILEVALELAEAEGIEALSMRRLAQELDVWPMSVYRYFQDKDALLDAMPADLNEDDYPALAGAGDALAGVLASEDEFTAGLDRLLDGLACRAGLSRA